MENKEFLRKLGEKIKVLRILKQYSQEYLAEKAQMDRGYISTIESGKANPSIIYLKQIADSLGCEMEELFKFFA